MFWYAPWHWFFPVWLWPPKFLADFLCPHSTKLFVNLCLMRPLTMVAKVPCFGSIFFRENKKIWKNKMKWYSVKWKIIYLPADAAYCFLLVKEGVELNQFRVMKVLKKKQTQICWNLNHYNWNDMKTSRKKILTFVVVQLVLLQLLEYEFLGAYSWIKNKQE